MTDEKELPCRECLCLSICRNRDMDMVFNKCSLIMEWFDPSKTNDPAVISNKVNELISFIRPDLFDDDKEDEDDAM